MTVLLLARHGETVWTREKRIQGHGDPPLNERGRGQAQALAETLGEVRLDAISSSDLLRASETATIVAAGRAIEVRLDPELRENDFGDWTGWTEDELELRFPQDALLRETGHKAWGGGESYEEMAGRIIRAVDRIAATHHPEDQILVVTHNGPIRAVHAHVSGVPYAEYRQRTKSIKKGSVSTVRLENGVWTAVASGLPGVQLDALFTVESPAARTRP